MINAKDFIEQEFVSKSLYKKEGECAIDHVHPLIIAFAQEIKDDLSDHYKQDVKIKINDWKWGGGRNYSGYREPECTVGGRRSQHRYGRGLDFIAYYKNKHTTIWIDADEVREYILNHQEKYRQFITRMESGLDAPTWTHVDRKESNKEGIYVFRA